MNETPNDPLWRQFLCWCAVLTFFSAPLAYFILSYLTYEVPTLRDLPEHGVWRDLGEWYRILAALVFGLAGLHSWDKRVEEKLQNGKVNK
jgi:hypothetical protein